MFGTHPRMLFLASVSILMTRTPHKARVGSAITTALWLCLAVFFTTAVQAAAKPEENATEVATHTDAPFAIADFDGDAQLDIATVQVGQIGASDTRYWIHFRLSSGVRQLIPVTAPLGGLHISSRDVNGDNFVDLVVTTAWHELPVAVLLNDGRGNFTPRDPHSFPAVMAPSPASTVSAGRAGNDIGVALLSRNSPSRCESLRAIGSQSQDTASPCASVCPPRNLEFVEVLLGRAPPVIHA